MDPSGHCYTISGMAKATVITAILATSYYATIGHNNRGVYSGNVYPIIYIYDIKSFLSAELLPAIWLIGETLTWQEEKLKDSTYRHHKNRCDRFPKRENYDSDCAYYAALISHTESCIRAYESWDKNYKPNRHSEKINNWKNIVRKNKKNYKRSCR